MTIFPDEYKLLRVINDNRAIAKIYLYSKNVLLYSGEIEDISPEKFEELQIFLKVLIKINKDSTIPTKIGIVETQWLLERFK